MIGCYRSVEELPYEVLVISLHSRTWTRSTTGTCWDTYRQREEGYRICLSLTAVRDLGFSTTFFGIRTAKPLAIVVEWSRKAGWDDQIPGPALLLMLLLPLTAAFRAFWQLFGGVLLSTSMFYACFDRRKPRRVATGKAPFDIRQRAVLTCVFKVE